MREKLMCGEAGMQKKKKTSFFFLSDVFDSKRAWTYLNAMCQTAK